MLFRRTARIRELSPGIKEDELVSSLEAKGLPVHRVGKGGVSVVSDNEEAVATVTFKDHDALNRALLMSPSDRRFKDGSIPEIDAEFDGFTPLSNGTDLDIVAIHGLYGHAMDTWQYSTPLGDCFVWLRDAFPSYFPRACILTYGYNADPEDNLSTARLRTYAETFLQQLRLMRLRRRHTDKPLIIFAHSLGGLIVKSALVLSKHNADSRYKNIIDNIRAIVFFSTPHSGGNTAALVELYARALQVSRNSTSTLDDNMVKELQVHSRSLYDLHNDFVQFVRLHKPEVYTFFETKKMPIGGQDCLIVDEQSARLGIAVEQVFGIYANHMDICKFKPGSSSLRDLRQLVRELVEELVGEPVPDSAPPVAQPMVTTRDALKQPLPPEGLKYANLADGDQLRTDFKNYPVMVSGNYTYWALSHLDNREGMTILAYDDKGTVVGSWEYVGARYVAQIKLNETNVEFIGQERRSISIPLQDLKIDTSARMY